MWEGEKLCVLFVSGIAKFEPVQWSKISFSQFNYVVLWGFDRKYNRCCIVTFAP